MLQSVISIHQKYHHSNKALLPGSFDSIISFGQKKHHSHQGPPFSCPISIHHIYASPFRYTPKLAQNTCIPYTVPNHTSRIVFSPPMTQHRAPTPYPPSSIPTYTTHPISTFSPPQSFPTPKKKSRRGTRNQKPIPKFRASASPPFSLPRGLASCSRLCINHLPIPKTGDSRSANPRAGKAPPPLLHPAKRTSHIRTRLPRFLCLLRTSSLSYKGRWLNHYCIEVPRLLVGLIMYMVRVLRRSDRTAPPPACMHLAFPYRYHAHSRSSHLISKT
jgi:hypothetical protein